MVARFVDNQTLLNAASFNTVIDAVNVAGEGIVNVAGEDSIDAAIAAAVSGSETTKQLYFPGGTYELDDIMEVSYRHNFVMRGDGPNLTRIIQTADNTPILRYITDPFAHHIMIRDLSLEYETQQGNTDTSAIAIEMWADANAQPNWISVENVATDNAHYGFKTTNTGGQDTVPFVVALRDIAWSRMSGPVVSVLDGSGKPNWIMERHYVGVASGADAPTGYAYEFAGVDLAARNITLDAWPNSILYSVGNGSPILMDNWHMEGGTQSVVGGPGFARNLLYIADGGVHAKNITFQATIDDPDDSFFFLFVLDGGDAYSTIDNVHSSALLTNGTLYPVSTTNGAQVRVNNILGTWTENPGLMAFGTSTAGILEVDNHHFLPTKAGAPTDADVPIARDGAQIVDTTNDRLYVRSGGTWMYTQLT